MISSLNILKLPTNIAPDFKIKYSHMYYIMFQIHIFTKFLHYWLYATRSNFSNWIITDVNSQFSFT